MCILPTQETQRRNTAAAGGLYVTRKTWSGLSIFLLIKWNELVHEEIETAPSELMFRGKCGVGGPNENF